MIDYGWQAVVQPNLLWRAVDLIIFRHNPDGTVALMQPAGVVVIDAATTFPEPTLRLDHTAAKALAEALASGGYQPDPDAKLQGTLEATRFHLDDMRALLKLRAK